MAIALIPDERNSIPDVPWFSDWTRRKANDGTTFAVHYLVVRPKGLLLQTSDFKVFVWASEKLHNVLLEHVGSSLDPDKGMPCVGVVPVATTKKGFAVGFDDEVLGYWVADGIQYSFLDSSTPPSEAHSLDLQGSGMVDSSPKTGRRAR